MAIIKDILKRFAKEEPTKADQTEVTAYRTNLYKGNFINQYNPDVLIQSKGAGVYAKMKTDDQVKATLAFKKSAIVSRPYFFEHDPEDPKQVEMAEAQQVIVDQMQGSFRDALVGILSALDNGYSVSEKVYQPINHNLRVLWGIKKIAVRPYDSFRFDIDTHGNIEEILQKAGGQDITIAPDKVIHYVHQPDIDEVYGESDLRACYRDWWSKDIIIKFRNIYLERHAAGFIKATVGAGLDARQLADLKSVIRNMSSQAGIIVPEGVTVELVNPTDTKAFEGAIAASDKAISKSLLVPNLLGLSEQGNVGSFSQSQTQFEAFIWVLDEIATRLEEALNEQLFRQLALWNFGTEDFPKFKFEPMSEQQKNQMLNTWGDLTQKGSVVHTETDEAHIRKLMAFPSVPEVPESEAVAPDSALNGAQVSSLVQIMEQVKAGVIPKTSAAQLINKAFPISLEEAEKMVVDIDVTGLPDDTGGGGNLPAFPADEDEIGVDDFLDGLDNLPEDIKSNAVIKILALYRNRKKVVA